MALAAVPVTAVARAVPYAAVKLGRAEDQHFQLGCRGERPVIFLGLEPEAALALQQIPGVKWSGANTVSCAWDAAPRVAHVLGRPAPVPPIVPDSAWDRRGIDAYRANGYAGLLRGYQKEAVSFLATRSHALLADPPRTGKTLALIAAATLVGARRVLVISPALAKWVWAAELRSWKPLATVAILEGSAANELRMLCQTCGGTGLRITASIA